ncbi:general secretion pathway protein L [Bradyrhizobium huanghuaihaiense]|uniref:General secretion pathway protein L n=1 Tax=Bradyrhizobium huanghuaihaiense TaxID=990078 RepID=A0A562R108_9BRAD|nr:PilN domain-containing protein [Bradyrhizobium huanghuaihaiense]TWI62755.1 general secretion pathway protein L [Bradyrhizobium huanghuaihaiense]
MSSLNSLRGILDAWTGTVAGTIVAALERVVAPRVVRLVETGTGAFALEASKSENVPNEITFEDGKFEGANLAQIVRGSRVEIVLRPTRFLFRPLELPARAADFLDGIVRAQIDRLTPWSAAEAVFGCSPPVAHGSESITTEIAAAPRRLAMGYVEALSGFHPSAIAIVTEAAEGPRIKVFEQKSRGAVDPVRLSRALQAVLALAAVAAVTGSVAASYLADSLSAQQSELERQITQRRAALRGSDGGERSPLSLLERRKYETPASVIVLESLSRLLPDHTYVTELHVAGNKIQIGGITRDAPSLIPLIEQSQHFTRATFYAPTTRSPSEPGERFHIEAQIEPRNVP